jgi:GNAT superfamily N-acetyltransferase
VKIRRARLDEAEGLTELVMAAKSHWGYSEAQLDLWRPSLAVTPELLASQPAFVMESDRLIGFCSLRLDGERCRLENLWILPREMRQGFGRVLLDHAKGFAKEAGATEMLIDSDPKAEGFYVRCGATVVERVAAPIEGQPDRHRSQLRLLLASETKYEYRPRARSLYDSVPPPISFRTYSVLLAMVGGCVLMADIALTSLWHAREVTSDVRQFAGLFVLFALPTWGVFAWLRHREARLAAVFQSHAPTSRREMVVWFVCVAAFVVALRRAYAM